MLKIMIIGGGVSGVYTAILLKRHHPTWKIEIIEQNDQLLKKLLVTGSGRCNLSNKDMSVLHYDTDHKKRVESIISDFDDQKELKKLGLYTKYLNDLLYPVSEQAKSVKKVMIDRLDELKVKIHLSETVSSVTRHDDFIIKTDKNTYHSDLVVLAMGSAAGGMSGANDRQEIVSKMPIPFKKMSPMLVSMNTDPFYKPLKGVRMKGKFWLQYHDQVLKEESGEMLFTDYGVSGIAVMQLSRFYRKGVSLHADLLPEISREELTKLVKGSFFHPLDGLLPVQMVQMINRKKIDPIHFTKDFQVQVTCLRDMKYAQAAKGGLALKGFDEYLEAVRVPGFFACGEILNVTGDCGGYNLHFAFSSAKRVAAGIERKYHVKN